MLDVGRNNNHNLMLQQKWYKLAVITMQKLRVL